MPALLLPGIPRCRDAHGRLVPESRGWAGVRVIPQPQQCHCGCVHGCGALAVGQGLVCGGCFLLPFSVLAAELRLYLPSPPPAPLPPSHLSPAFLAQKVFCFTLSSTLSSHPQPRLLVL